MPDIYRTAGLELDTSRFQVRRDGQVVAVQPQVFDVLHYLVEHRDRVVSKEELLENVWAGRFVSDAALSSRIKSVRQLIGDTGRSQGRLQTLRHRGFRYVAPVESEQSDARRLVQPATPARESGPATGIAVRPFETPDAEQMYAGEGIAADVISLLARHHWLKVVSRGSSFAPSLRNATPREAGAVLGVDYLVTGRMRRNSDRLRIDAELTSCAEERLLWSESFDIAKTALFDVQEEIASRISAAIERQVGQLEQRRIQRKRAEDLDAWDSCHKAFWHLYHFTAPDLDTAKKWFAKALESSPDLARAHSGLAYSSVQLAFYGPPENRDAELQAALTASQHAVALDPWDAFNRFVFGRALCLSLRFPEAQAELEAAIETNRSFAQAHYALAFCYTVWDRPEQALPLYDRAMQLSPQDPHLWAFHHMRSIAHFRLDQLEDAERHVRAAIRQQYATYWPFATLCALLADQGRLEEAAAIADRLLRMKPDYSLAFARQDYFFTHATDFVERYLRGLAAAGIPAKSKAAAPTAAGSDTGPRRRLRAS